MGNSYPDGAKYIVVQTIQDDLKQLSEELPAFLETLRPESALVGRYLPCLKGLTEVGRNASLSFSCFALKTAYTIGIWDTLPSSERVAWLEYIKSFQKSTDPGGSPNGRYAFIDEGFLNGLPKPTINRWRLLIGMNPKRMPGLPSRGQCIASETKQAIATLAQVGAQPERPYISFPTKVKDVHAHLTELDWSMPWSAGAQASALTTIIAAQKIILAEQTEIPTYDLLSTCSSFFDEVVDPETGAYFKDQCPDHDQLVNGAMKVLTALDWLEMPPHYPTTLIDTTLAKLPSSEGCHLVDAVYVLYQCSKVTEHRRADIVAFCDHILEMLLLHRRTDGGLSYFNNRAQVSYYSARISDGMNCGDIHGTCLLTWALSMILEIFEDDHFGWRVIRP